MSPYSEITIHYQFSSLAQKEKYLLSYNGQYYEASHAFVKLVGGLQQQEKEEAMRKSVSYTHLGQEWQSYGR